MLASFECSLPVHQLFYEAVTFLLDFFLGQFLIRLFLLSLCEDWFFQVLGMSAFLPECIRNGNGHRIEDVHPKIPVLRVLGFLSEPFSFDIALKVCWTGFKEFLFADPYRQEEWKSVLPYLFCPVDFLLDGCFL